jgi:hypothetical protein
MATHRFSCPTCGKTLKVDDELLARTRASGAGTHCPRCKAPVSVEGVGSSTARTHPGHAAPARTAADDLAETAARFGLDAAALRRVVEEGAD